MHEIITREQAIARGLSHYFTGKPCVRGHISTRRLPNKCMECGKEDAKAYYEKNRSTCIEKSSTRADKNRDYLREYARAYYKKNKIEIIEKYKKSRNESKERYNATQRDRRARLKAEADFGPPKPTRALWNSAGKSVCGECGDVKSSSDFASGLYHCKPCKARIKREYDAANPERKAAARARAAERAGKTYKPAPHLRGPAPKSRPPRVITIDGARWYMRPCAGLEAAHEGQAFLAAQEAWRYLLNVRASDEWVRRYFELRGDPWNNPRISAADKYRIRYAIDVEFNISERLRRQITKKRKRDGIGETMRGAIRRGGESRVVKEAFGYTIAQLKSHLEIGFHDGMDWDAFMRGEIHIDHIKPQAAFDMSDDEQYKACWALENLRPLWAEDNLAKSDRMPCGNRWRAMRKAA